jgi:hypothetical protein
MGVKPYRPGFFPNRLIALNCYCSQLSIRPVERDSPRPGEKILLEEIFSISVIRADQEG